MQINVLRFTPRILLCLGAALLCLHFVDAFAADTDPTPIQAEIMLLQDLAETQQDASLKQLVHC